MTNIPNKLTNDGGDKINIYNCPVYAFRFDDNFELDIDYVVDTIKVESNSDIQYKYLVAPANIIFFDVRDIRINIKADWLNGFEFYSIERNMDDPKLWLLELQEGEIEFKSSGYKLLIRMDPVIRDRQYLSEVERGGISFKN